MSDLDDLIEFFLARIAEDEAAARSATRGPWRYDPSKFNAVDHEESVFAGPRGASVITVASTGPCDDVGSMADADHIARHDPARVLRECEAKRRIVEGWPDPFGEWSAGQADAARSVKDSALRALASVHSDHPDYDPAWRP